MAVDDFSARYGPWAIVAGASLGLGAAWCHALAARGLNLVMIAETDAPLNQVAAEVAERHAVRTLPVVADLGHAAARSIIAETTSGLDVGLLVYNAAVSPVGRFDETPAAAMQATIDVNCRAPVELCDEVLSHLRQRGRGGIVLMSSLSALQGQAMVGLYAATKAFNLVLAESLGAELGEHGIDVLAVCPGATKTPGFTASRPRMQGWMKPPVMKPEPVVEEAIAALGKQPVVIPGRNNRITAFVFRHLVSRRRAVRFMSRVTRAMYERR